MLHQHVQNSLSVFASLLDQKDTLQGSCLFASSNHVHRNKDPYTRAHVCMSASLAAYCDSSLLAEHDDSMCWVTNCGFLVCRVATSHQV